MRIALAAAAAALLTLSGALAADNPQRQRVRERDAALAERARDRGAEASTLRIIGGDKAGANEWPWQVALLFSDIADEHDAQFCGGTLINREWVVTAAHCVEGMRPNELNVLTQTNLLDGSGVRRGVASITVHKKYSAKTLEFDIAVVRLGTSLPKNYPVAELITDKEEQKYAEPGDTMTVTGWGSIARSGDKYPVELREARVPVVANDVCNEAKAYKGDITSRMICAGELDGSRGVCSGDSGGPLLARNKKGEFRLLTGVVSFGTIPCAFKKHPAVFTRISSYRNWILDRTRN